MLALKLLNDARRDTRNAARVEQPHCTSDLTILNHGEGAGKDAVRARVGILVRRLAAATAAGECLLTLSEVPDYHVLSASLTPSAEAQLGHVGSRAPATHPAPTQEHVMITQVPL